MCSLLRVICECARMPWSADDAWRGRLRAPPRAQGAWRVKCSCGARDDDGERMVSCEMCEVWVHTRCEGVPEADAPPESFICEQCARAQRGGSKRQRRK